MYLLLHLLGRRRWDRSKLYTPGVEIITMPEDQGAPRRDKVKASSSTGSSSMEVMGSSRSSISSKVKQIRGRD